MKKNLTDLISTGIRIYTVTILLYYGAWILFLENKTEDISLPQLLYTFIGILLLYLCGRAIRGWFAKTHSNRTFKRVSPIARFDLTTLLLLLAAVTAELRSPTDVNIAPVAAAVIINLAEVTVKKEARFTGRLIAIYILVLSSAYLLVLEKTKILKGALWIAEVFGQIARAFGNAAAHFFNYITDHFADQGTKPLFASDGSSQIHAAVYVIAVILLFALCALAAGLLKHRARFKRLKRAAPPLPMEMKEPRDALCCLRRWKFLFKPAKTPQAFLFKAAWICRRSDFPMKDSESPRQFLNKLLDAKLLDEADGNLIADQIDWFYYSNSLYKIPYERSHGERLIKELKIRLRKN